MAFFHGQLLCDVSVHAHSAAAHLLLQRQAACEDAGPEPVPQEGNGSNRSSLAALVRGCLHTPAGVHEAVSEHLNCADRGATARVHPTVQNTNGA